VVKPIEGENRQTSARRPIFSAKLVYFCIGACSMASLCSALLFTYWGVIWPLQGHGTYTDVVETYPQNYIGMPIGFFLAIAFASMLRNVRIERAYQQVDQSIEVLVLPETTPKVEKARITVHNALPFFMLSLGLASLLTSFLSNSYILALIGLGLTFWGALFLYMKTTKYVKLELLTAAASSPAINLERMLILAEINSKGIYLPPKLLQDYQSSLIFIPVTVNDTLPKREDVPDEKTLATSRGLFLTPLGLALSRLFEKELGISFAKLSLSDLTKQLPRLLEKLGITKTASINVEGEKVTFETGNYIFKDLCMETRKLQRTHETVGCPFSSAIACALAKTTGKPVTIEQEEQNPDGETTTIKYRILKDRSKDLIDLVDLEE